MGKLTQTINLKKLKPEERKAVEDFRKVANARKYKGIELNLSQRADAKGLKDYEQINRDFVRAQLEMEVLEPSVTELTEQLNRVEKEIKDKGAVTVDGVTTKIEYTDEANAELSKKRAEISAKLSAVKKKYDREKTRRDKAAMDKKRFDENTAERIVKYNGDKNVKLNMTEEHYMFYLRNIQSENIKNNNDQYDARTDLYDNGGIERMAADFDELMPQIVGKEQMFYSEEAVLPPIFRISINGKSPAEYWYKKAGQEKKFEVDGKVADKPEDLVMHYTSTIKAAIMMALIEGDAKITYVPLDRENFGDAINRYKAGDAKDISVDLSDYAVIKNAWMEQNKKNLKFSKEEAPAKVDVKKEQKRVQKLIDKNYKEIEKAYKDKNGKAGYSPLEKATEASKRVVKEYKKAIAEIIRGKYADEKEQRAFDTRSSIQYNKRIGDLGNRQLNGYLDEIKDFALGKKGDHLALEISKVYEQAGEGEKAGKVAEYLKFTEADAVLEADKNLRNLDIYNSIKTIRERYHKILSGNNIHYTDMAKTSQVIREILERNPDSKASAFIVTPASRSILKFYRDLNEQYKELMGIFPHTKTIDGELFDMPSIDEKMFIDESKRKRYVDLSNKILNSINSLRTYGDKFFQMSENGISMKEFESMFTQMMDEAKIGSLKADMDELSLLLGEALLEKNVAEKADYFENKAIENDYVYKYAGSMAKLDHISNFAGKIGDMLPDETDNELKAEKREKYGMDFKGEDQAKLKEAKNILKGLGDPNRHANYNINKSDRMSEVVRADLKDRVDNCINVQALEFLAELTTARKEGNEAKIAELMQRGTITDQDEETERLRTQREQEYKRQRDEAIQKMQLDIDFKYENKAPLSFLRDVERNIWYTISAGVNAEELGAEFTNVNNIEGFKNAAKEFNTRINAEIDTALTDLQKAEDEAEYTRLSLEKNKGDIEFGNIELRELNDKGEALDNEVLENEALVEEYEKNKAQYDKTSAELQAKYDELAKGKSEAIAKDEDGESYNQARQNAKSIIDGAQNNRKLGEILKDKAINIDGAIKPVDKSEKNAKKYDDMTIEEFLEEYQRVRPEYGNSKDKFVEAHPALQKRYEEIFGLYDRADNDLKIIDVLEDKKPVDELSKEYGGMITDLKKTIESKKEEIAYMESRCTQLAEESVKLQAENEELINKLAEQKADAAQKKDKFEHLKDTKDRVADIEVALDFTIENQKDNMYRSYNKYLESKSRYKDEAERQAALEKTEMERMQKYSDAVAKEQKEQLAKLNIPNEKLVGYLNELIDLRSQVRTAAGLKAVRKDAEETFENARALIEKNKELKALFAGNKAVPKNGNRDWKHERVAAIKEGKFFANNGVQKLLISATKGGLFSDANQVTPIHDEVMVPIEKYVKAFQSLENIVERYKSREVMPEKVAKEYDKLSKMTFEDKATGKKRNLLDDVKEAAKPNGMRPLYTEFDLKQVEAVYRSIRHGELNYMVETLLKPFDKSKQLVDKAVEIPKEEVKNVEKKEVSKEKVDLKEIAEDKKVAVLGKESKTAQKEKVKTV